MSLHGLHKPLDFIIDLLPMNNTYRLFVCWGEERGGVISWKMKERKRNYGVCVFQIVVKCERSKLVLPNIRATKQDHNLDPIKYHPPTHPPYHKPYACLPPFLPKRDPPPPGRSLAIGWLVPLPVSEI